MLVNSARLRELRTAGGLIIGNQTVIPYDAVRIRLVVERIVRGLLWHHYGATVPPGAILQTHFRPALDDIRDILMAATLNSIGDTIFRYRHARVSDEPDSSIWGLQFYERAHFVVPVLSEAAQTRNFDESEEPRSQTSEPPVSSS